MVRKGLEVQTKIGSAAQGLNENGSKGVRKRKPAKKKTKEEKREKLSSQKIIRGNGGPAGSRKGGARETRTETDSRKSHHTANEAKN